MYNKNDNFFIMTLRKSFKHLFLHKSQTFGFKMNKQDKQFVLFAYA